MKRVLAIGVCSLAFLSDARADITVEFRPTESVPWALASGVLVAANGGPFFTQNPILTDGSFLILVRINNPSSGFYRIKSDAPQFIDNSIDRLEFTGATSGKVVRLIVSDLDTFDPTVTPGFGLNSFMLLDPGDAEVHAIISVQSNLGEFRASRLVPINTQTSSARRLRAHRFARLRSGDNIAAVIKQTSLNRADSIVKIEAARMVPPLLAGDTIPRLAGIIETMGGDIEEIVVTNSFRTTILARNDARIGSITVGGTMTTCPPDIVPGMPGPVSVCELMPGENCPTDDPGIRSENGDIGTITVLGDASFEISTGTGSVLPITVAEDFSGNVVAGGAIQSIDVGGSIGFGDFSFTANPVDVVLAEAFRFRDTSFVTSNGADIENLEARGLVAGSVGHIYAMVSASGAIFNIDAAGSIADVIEDPATPGAPLEVLGSLSAGGEIRALNAGGDLRCVTNCGTLTEANVDGSIFGGDLTVGAFGKLRAGGNVDSNIFATTSFAVDSEIAIGESLMATRKIDLPALGLQGQVTFNNAGGASTPTEWDGSVEIGATVLTNPAGGDGQYTNLAASLGGGSIGLVPFGHHEESSNPVDASATDISVLPNGLGSARMRFYGPLLDLSAANALPFKFEHRATVLDPWQEMLFTEFDANYTYTTDRQELVITEKVGAPIGFTVTAPQNERNFLVTPNAELLCLGTDVATTVDQLNAYTFQVFEPAGGPPGGCADLSPAECCILQEIPCELCNIGPLEMDECLCLEEGGGEECTGDGGLLSMQRLEITGQSSKVAEDAPRLVFGPDFNDDGVVNDFDLNQMMRVMGKSGPTLADLNHDFVVDGKDMELLLAAFGPIDK